MDRNELFKYLSDYGNVVKDGSAKTSNFVDIKNKIRQAYDSGNIDKEMMKELSDKASGAWKNMGRTSELQDISNKIIEKGGTASGVEGMTSRLASKPASTASKFGKTMKALGILGPAAAAMSISDKAMAGDFGGAAMEGVDLATDYLPGVGQVKEAIRPEELANSELPSEEMNARRLFNESRKAKGAPPAQAVEGLEEPVRYSDMQQQISKRFNTLNKMK